ncbi:hypothetical protein CCP3SC15_1960002 [Gammaproteobacteria bacterium]
MKRFKAHLFPWVPEDIEGLENVILSSDFNALRDGAVEKVAHHLMSEGRNKSWGDASELEQEACTEAAKSIVSAIFGEE